MRISYNFWGQGLLEDFKVVFRFFGVWDYNIPFSFLDWRLGRSCLLLDSALKGQCYPWFALWDGSGEESAFWEGAEGEEVGSNNADLVQSRILDFDDAFRRLETLGYWNVVQYQVGYPELTVYMDKHIGLQDLIQTRLVHEIKVGNSRVLICKTIRKKNISLAKQNNAN